VSEQSLYNLNARMIELEVLPACADYGLGVIPWSPLGGGLLGGVLADRERGGRRGGERIQASIEAQRPKLEAWEKLCAEIGAPPSDVALAWLLHNPTVTAPIIGPRTVAQLDDAMGALDVHLTDDVLAQLDQIFPGPGGPAPEAYAW
jgi:aryl-alcohol dehydrogenase-like predicted oxidoreductase